MSRLSRIARSSSRASRRDFLRSSAKGLLGVSMLPLVASAPSTLAANPASAAIRHVPTAKKVIYLFMSGGMSHLDTFDVKPGTEVQGATKAINTSVDGIQVAEHLPKTAQLMHHIALLRGMNSTQGAHEQGRYMMLTSYDKRGTIVHPGMSSWVANMSGRINPKLPANVLIGGGSNHPGAGWMESAFAPLHIRKPEAGLQHSTLPEGVSEERFNARLGLAEQLQRGFQQKYDHKKVRAYSDLYHEAVKLMRSEDLAAFDISKEPASVRDAYGGDTFAQGCLLARRLVEHDVRYVEVELGGWDTHDDNFERVGDRAATLDHGLATLLTDLFQRGMLDETLVVLATEFGRTPRINERNGRDHFPKAFTCLMAGGGVKGAQAYGATDEHGASVVSGLVGIPDLNASIAYALGLDTEQTLYSSDQRPFTVAHRGKPVWAISLMRLVVCLFLVPFVLAAEESSSLDHWADFFGRFHMVILHMPIGIIAVAMAMQLWFARSASQGHRTALAFLWRASAITVWPTIILGLLLARSGGYNDDYLMLHQWAGIALGACCVAMVVLSGRYADRQPPLMASVPMLAVMAGLLVTVGHAGGSLTHGPTYLFAKAPWDQRVKDGDNKSDATSAPILSSVSESAAQPGEGASTAHNNNAATAMETQHMQSSAAEVVPAVAVAPGASASATSSASGLGWSDIQPIMQRYCIDCHGESKSKAGLRLDTYQHTMEGAKVTRWYILVSQIVRHYSSLLLCPLMTLMLCPQMAGI